MALTDGLLTHTCTVKRPTEGQDARGGDNITLTPVATGVAILIDQASDNMRRARGGAQLNMTHIGYAEIEQKGVILTNDILTDVTRMGDPADVQMDNFGPQGQQPTQYRVLDANPPNLEPDHLEIGLEQMQGRPAAPTAT